MYRMGTDRSQACPLSEGTSSRSAKQMGDSDTPKTRYTCGLAIDRSLNLPRLHYLHVPWILIGALMWLFLKLEFGYSARCVSKDFNPQSSFMFFVESPRLDTLQ